MGGRRPRRCQGTCRSVRECLAAPRRTPATGPAVRPVASLLVTPWRRARPWCADRGEARGGEYSAARPPGADGTLLAVVPIPGTGTSLAIVGYPVTAPERAAVAVPLGPIPEVLSRRPGAGRAALPARRRRPVRRRASRAAARSRAAAGLGGRRRGHADLPGIRAARLPRRAPGDGVQPRRPGAGRSGSGTSPPTAARSTCTSAACGTSSAPPTAGAWSPSTASATSSAPPTADVRPATDLSDLGPLPARAYHDISGYTRRREGREMALSPPGGRFSR